MTSAEWQVIRGAAKSAEARVVRCSTGWRIVVEWDDGARIWMAEICRADGNPRSWGSLRAASKAMRREIMAVAS